jgi:hypothetical protein
VGGTQQQLAVLERARLALVAVDDDEGAVVRAAAARGADGVAHVAPLLRRGHARPAHAAQVGVGVVQLVQQPVGPTAPLGALRPAVVRLPHQDRLAHVVVVSEAPSGARRSRPWPRRGIAPPGRPSN